METSAKTGHNVEKAFRMIVDQILIKIDNKMLDVELEDGIRKWPQSEDIKKSVLK